MAIEHRRGLDTAITAPLRITLKSEMHAYHVDEPKQLPSTAAAQGVSRMRWYWVGSAPSMLPMPRLPMVSGIRAPELSPSNTSGSPRWAATRFIWPILRPLVAVLEAPLTVQSLETSATSRPSMRP